MYNESQTDGRFITNDHWSLAKIIHDVLETFDNTTHIFSYIYEPNIHMVILERIKIICTIKQTSQVNPDPSIKDLLDNMKVKWCAYFNEFPPIYAIAAILDPGVKLQEYVKIVNPPQPVGSSMCTSRFEFLGPVLKKQRPDWSGHHHHHHHHQIFPHNSMVEKIILQSFPILARIAKDILTIPASTIAFESAFSASRRVLDEKDLVFLLK
ncbi:putative AC9 transposase, partial [Bienertia sinuspersici]